MVHLHLKDCDGRPVPVSGPHVTSDAPAVGEHYSVAAKPVRVIRVENWFNQQVPNLPGEEETRWVHHKTIYLNAKREDL